MVDALREANRVLVPGGTLLDLRPLAEASVLHLCEGMPVGELDATGLSADDEAAQAAIERAVRLEWFRPRQPKRVRPSLDEVLSAWRAPAELCTRRTVMLDVYRKPGTRVAQIAGTQT